MIEELKSADPETRRRAVASLEGSEHEARAAALVGALGDVDWRVRKEAARVATAVAEAWGLFDELVEALSQGENVGLRNAALEVLERLGPRGAEPLLDALPRVPETARKFVVAALGFAGRAAADSLARLSNDRDPNTAQAALEALARVGGARAEEALRAHLASADPVQRLAALEGLERLEAHVSPSELAPSLADRLVRRLALRLLAFSDEPSAVPTLLDALEDAPANAIEGAVALGRMLSRGGPAAREVASRASTLREPVRATLRALAQDDGDAPRRAATWILLLARDEAVLGAAAELAADDRLPPVALDAIRRWGADAVEPLLAVAGSLAPRPRAAALEMAADLAAVGEPSAAQLAALRAGLRTALDGEDAVSAASAAAALERFAYPEDAPRLVAAATRFGEPVARVVGRTLSRLAESAPSAVEAALRDVALDGPVGAALLPALAALGGAAAADLVQAALSADDPRARRAAVLALDGLGDERGVELAGFALADEDLTVQTAAVTVLGRIAARAEPAGGDVAERVPRAVEHLRVALRASAEPVVAAAARALGAIEDQGSRATLRELVTEARPGVAVAAMEALRALADPALDDLLVEALGQGDEELVKEALRAIAEREGVRREARIALGLEHAAWDVRQLAATLLGREAGAAAQEALRARLPKETDPSVRAAIEEALERAARRGAERSEGDA